MQEACIARAFSDGYLLAMTEGMKVLTASIKDQAIEDSLQRLEPLIESRVQSLNGIAPRTLMDLQAKQEEFRKKLLRSTTTEDKVKYTHYLEALDWMLHANGLHPNQSISA